MDWLTILKLCGFQVFTPYEGGPPDIMAFTNEKLRIDVLPSGNNEFTARLLAGTSYRGLALAGGAGKTKSEAFHNLLNSRICKTGSTVSEIIGSTEYAKFSNR